MFLLEQEPEEKRCKIAIVCGSGKIIGRLIENQLKKVFDVEPEFEFFYGIFDENRKDDFDYIVTTTELHMDTKTPIVFMDEVFDREYIQRKFENMRYLSEAGRTIRKGIDSLFMNLLDETRFLFWIKKVHMMRMLIGWQGHLPIRENLMQDLPRE